MPAIGLSAFGSSHAPVDMTVPMLRLVLRDARVRPAADEVELRPHAVLDEIAAHRLAHRTIEFDPRS